MAQNFYIVVVLILCNKSFIFLLIVIVKVSVYFQRLPKKGERREKKQKHPSHIFLSIRRCLFLEQ